VSFAFVYSAQPSTCHDYTATARGRVTMKNPNQNRRLSLGLARQPAMPMPSRVLDRRWRSDALVEVFRDRLIQNP